MTLDTVPATHWSTLLVLVTGKLAPARQEAAMDVKTLYRTLHPRFCRFSEKNLHLKRQETIFEKLHHRLGY